jgi:hypothetical protein
LSAEREVPSGGRPAARAFGAAGAAASGAGAALVSAASAVCCTGPGLATLVVTVLGAGGAAWAAGLKPYSAYLSAGSLLLIGFGFWSTRRPRGCRVETKRTVLWSRRVARAMLWFASVVWVASVAIQMRGWFGGGVG